MNKLNLNLSIDLTNSQHAMFYGLLMKEVGKYGIDVTFGNITTTTTTEQSKPSTAKAVEKKPTTTTAKAVKKSSKYECKNDYTFTLALDSKGYVTISTEDGHSSGAWCLASKALLENGFTRPQGDKAHYMVVGKNGSISKKLTKEAYDGYENHQLVISAKAINAYNEERYGRA